MTFVLPPPRRGRPLGTGIDDSDILRRLAALVRQQNLKPTTALKMLGVTDISHLRRIRDKYHKSKRAA